MTSLTNLSPTVAQTQQLYLQRVNQLYTNIQDWLQDNPLTLTIQELKLADGWYWEEQFMDTPPHLLNQSWLLKLITWVSDYEFD